MKGVIPVSVLMPVRGNGKFLLESLNSISDSNVQPSQIILIDDGLNKEILGQIERNIELRNLEIHPNQNPGLVNALNSGLALAREEFIARLDSDDLMFPGRLLTQFNFLQANTNVSVVGSQVEYIDDLGNTIGFSKYPVNFISDLAKFKMKSLLAHPAVMFRLSKVLEVGGYRSVFRYKDTDLAEDFDLWLRLSNISSCFNLDDVLTKYRQHPTQLSRLNSIPQELATIYASAIGGTLPGPEFQVILSKNGRINGKDAYLLIENRLGKTWKVYFGLRQFTFKQVIANKNMTFFLEWISKLFRKIFL
jgi:glycosyltransferase involved in cell wall biosynthesis